MLITRSKVLVLAAIAVALLWIEHSERIRIEAPTPAAASAQATGCPANESTPFSPECMAFIQGTLGPSYVRHNHPDSVSVESPELH